MAGIRWWREKGSGSEEGGATFEKIVEFKVQVLK